MQLADTLVLRCYHLPVYDWTPLSQDPCWRCSVIRAFWMCRTRQTFTAYVHSSRLSQKTTGFIIAWIGRLKSWENDPEGSGCCKCWEWSLYHDPLRHSPRLTICPPSFINFIQQTVHDGFTHTEPFAVQLLWTDLFTRMRWPIGSAHFLKIRKWWRSRLSPLMKIPSTKLVYGIFVVNAFKELVAGVIKCRVGQDGVSQLSNLCP